MTSCHECGSDVAENDVFCPYCGISLKPITIDDEEAADDASLDNTLVMNSGSDAAFTEDHQTPATSSSPSQTLGDSVEEESGAQDDVTLQDIEVPSLNAEEPDPAAEEIRSEPSASLTDIDKVPVPQALTALESTAGQLFKDVEGRKPSTDQADSTEANAKDLNADPFERGSVAESTEEHEQFESPAPVSQVDVFNRFLSPDNAEPEPTSAEAGQEGEISGPPEQGISMPLDVPVPADQYSAPSRFDSVRIMDAAEGETLISAGSGRSVNAQSDLAGLPGPENTSSPTDAESRSETASSIGMGDTDGRRSSKLKPLEEGSLLNGRYEVVRKIGGGGMGAVYLSSDNNLGGVLRAVKEMVQSHIEEEQQEKAVQDFKRESMILSTLDHPSIPTIYDYFFDENESRFYLVMKYISGGDLAARMRSAPEGKLDEITVTEWGIQIADVLDYLHNQPSTIVYRDLKPSNIMIDGNSGRVMLIDFGIARSIGQREEKGVTAVGTMGYAPPELFSGNVEPRSDIYSLGSTMFHLLTGADPQSNPLLIFDFQKNPRPRQINPQLSDQIERFLMKAVEYNASSRFSSAVEVRRFLEEHLDNLRKGKVTYGVKEIPASVSLANQSVFCGFCGQKIVATDLFCAFCGAKQPIAQQGVHSEIYTPAPMTAKLFVMGTNDLDSPIFQLEKTENLLGRRDPMSNIFPEVDLSKYDPQTKISRRHAKIWREGSNFLVEDLASSNGTVVLPAGNDSLRLLPHKPYTLSNGDKLKLGDTTLHFVVG